MTARGITLAVLAMILTAGAVAAEPPGGRPLTPLERHRLEQMQGRAAPVPLHGWVTAVGEGRLVTSLSVEALSAQGLGDEARVLFIVQGRPFPARLFTEAALGDLLASGALGHLGVDVIGILDGGGHLVIVALYGDLAAAFDIRPGAPVAVRAR